MNKQEEAMRIMEALTGVDEELLARCEAENIAGAGADTADSQEGAACRTDRRRKRNIYKWRYLGSCAAVLVLAAAGIAYWQGFGIQGERLVQDLTADSARSGGSTENFMAEAESVLPRGTAGGVNASEDGYWDDTNGSQNTVEVKNSLQGKEDNFEEADRYQAAITAQNKGIEPSAAPAAPGDDAAPGNADSLSEGQRGTISGKTEQVLPSEKTEAIGCPPAPAEKKLTAAEAGQVEILGAYVPTRLPAGYVFETAGYVAGDGEAADALTGQGRLMLTWRKGMDSIRLCIERTDDAVETADVGKPKSYDERLYEIPYGDTVPEEYRKTFLAPVFAKDDFSLEIVRSRVISYSGDGGDTATPRGNFSVLYDGVLVQFNGRGTPEEIWEMFASMQK